MGNDGDIEDCKTVVGHERYAAVAGLIVVPVDFEVIDWDCHGLGDSMDKAEDTSVSANTSRSPSCLMPVLSEQLSSTARGGGRGGIIAGISQTSTLIY